MAKKRYYEQSAKDRLDESRGMERELYGKKINKLKKKLKDEKKNGNSKKSSQGNGSFNGTLHEDPSAPSYLPQKSVYKYWPKTSYENNPSLGDTIQSIDQQMDDDVQSTRKHRSKSKY